MGGHDQPRKEVEKTSWSTYIGPLGLGSLRRSMTQGPGQNNVASIVDQDSLRSDVFVTRDDIVFSFTSTAQRKFQDEVR